MNSVQPVASIPLGKAMAGILACARQRRLVAPVDLTVDNEAYVPIFRTAWKTTINNTDFTSSGRSPTIPIIVARGFKIDFVWASFHLPAQVARELTDKFAYDNLPGINCLQQIEASIGGSIQLETVQPTAIIQRLIRYFGIDMFKVLARKLWGGFRDANECGPLQKLTGVSASALSTTDLSKNEVFPKILIRLPIPISLFFNNERFNFFLSMDTPLEVKFIFKNASNFISRSLNATLNEVGDSIDVHMEYLNPNEYVHFWNSLPYTQITPEPYYTKDAYFETFTKNYGTKSDYRVQLRTSITTELQCHITLKDYETGATFFGLTTADAVSNQLGGMISPITTNLNPVFTINLNTGHFLSPANSSTSGTISIVGWAQGVTEFDVVWNRTSVSSTVVTIKSVAPFGTFGDLYLDLSTYATNLSTGGMNNVLQGGIFFLCRSLTLDIRPFSNEAGAESPSISLGAAKKLRDGFYSFNPDPNVANVNRHAFWRIYNVEPNKMLRNDGEPEKVGFAFDFLASRPVPETHTVNMLVQRDFVRVAKNQQYFYDLDCKWPIEVEEVQFEKAGSNSDIFGDAELWFSRQWKREVPHRWLAPIDLAYSYVDKDGKDSNGYQDYRLLDIINYVVKLKNTRIRYDGVELIDVLKVLDNSEFCFTSLQWSLRELKSQDNVLTSIRDDNTVSEINDQIIRTIRPESARVMRVEQNRGQLSAYNTNGTLSRAYQRDNYSRNNAIVDTQPSSKRPRIDYTSYY